MIPKSLIERLVKVDVYIYIRHLEREFGGVLDSFIDENIVVLKDKYNNLIYIPLEIIDVITERQ